MFSKIIFCLFTWLSRLLPFRKSTIQNGANTQDVGLGFQGDITVGEFVDRPRPTFVDNYNTRMNEILKDKFVPYEEPK